MSRTIGSSDVASILGLSPWGSPWGAWSRLHGLTGYDSEGSAATRRGTMLESALLQRYAEETGRDVRPGPPLGEPGILHPDHPWAHARPDGITDDLLVEVKTARYLDEAQGWGQQGTDEVPTHYLVQCLWQMACCGFDLTHLVAFGVARDDYRVYVIRRRPELEAQIVARVAAWHKRHIVDGHMPEPDGSAEARRALGLAYPAQGERPTMEADEETARIVATLQRIRERSASLKAEEAHLRTVLMARMGEAGALVDAEGRKLARWSDRKGRQRLDGARLLREQPEIHAQYTTAGEPGRSLTILSPETTP